MGILSTASNLREWRNIWDANLFFVFWFCFISDCFCHFNCFIQSLEVFLKFYLSILALCYFLTSITRQHSERLSWTSISIFINSTRCQIEKKVKCPPFSNNPNLPLYIYSIHGYKIETRSRWHAENVNKLNSNSVTLPISNYRVCVKRKNHYQRTWKTRGIQFDWYKQLQLLRNKLAC